MEESVLEIDISISNTLSFYGIFNAVKRVLLDRVSFSY